MSIAVKMKKPVAAENKTGTFKPKRNPLGFSVVVVVGRPAVVGARDDAKFSKTVLFDERQNLLPSET
uniref:Uncharacterized protein n=1 Tax=Romanomermis culicivorax TaxID=13658 RepID=A0A915I965_ROMCU